MNDDGQKKHQHELRRRARRRRCLMEDKAKQRGGKTWVKAVPK
jgi:hypothetical protein